MPKVEAHPRLPRPRCRPVGIAAIIDLAHVDLRLFSLRRLTTAADQLLQLGLGLILACIFVH